VGIYTDIPPVATPLSRGSWVTKEWPMSALGVRCAPFCTTDFICCLALLIMWHEMALIYLILKSYTKYKIDRDRTIARNTDKNREEKDFKKPAQKTQGTCATLFMRHIC